MGGGPVTFYRTRVSRSPPERLLITGKSTSAAASSSSQHPSTATATPADRVSLSSTAGPRAHSAGSLTELPAEDALTLPVRHNARHGAARRPGDGVRRYPVAGISPLDRDAQDRCRRSAAKALPEQARLPVFGRSSRQSWYQPDGRAVGWSRVASIGGGYAELWAVRRFVHAASAKRPLLF